MDNEFKFKTIDDLCLFYTSEHLPRSWEYLTMTSAEGLIERKNRVESTFSVHLSGFLGTHVILYLGMFEISESQGLNLA